MVALEHEVLAEVWMLTQRPGGKFEFAFAIGRTPQELYKVAGLLMGGDDTPYNKAQLIAMGYKAEKVLIVKVQP